MNPLLRFATLTLLSGLTAWAIPEPMKAPVVVSAPATEDEIGITATLVTPRDVLVEWKDTKPGAAGYIIEWGTKPDDEFVPLGFFPPEQTSHKHPDLMPETVCYYRIRAFYGPPSEEVEISVPKEVSDDEFKKRFDGIEDYGWAGPETAPDEKPVEKKSIRNPATASEASPINLTLTLKPVTVSGFQMQWTDRASDEEGFFIETKPEGKSRFWISALVQPNINKFGWTVEPPARKTAVRVRPYYFGRSSQFVHLTTGAEEPEKSAEAPAQPAPKPST
jgi:hypothetical protein